MKIAVISPSFFPATYYGGPIYSTYNIAKTLAGEGIKVFVSTTNANGNKRLNVPVNKFIEIKKNLFVKYYSFANSKGFSPLMFLCLLSDLIKADIVYLISVFSPPTPLTLLLSSLLGKKVILSPRGQVDKWCLKQGSSFKKLWLFLFIKPFKKITWNATSEQEKEMIHEIFPKAKVAVIPPAIDASEFENKGTERSFEIYNNLTGRDLSGRKIIVALGRLQKVKGFDILINAISIVRDKYPQIVLLIAGEDFGEGKNLERIIRSFGLHDRVFLIGNIEGKDKADFLINADIFALSSHHENFGIAYAEAMAAGLPVIASKNTPWQDVEKYNCGKWVDNTPEDFAQAILGTVNLNYKEMGRKAREFVREKYNSTLLTKEYIKLFNSI